MKITELIKQLQKLMEKHGNLDMDIDLRTSLGEVIIGDKKVEPEFFHEVKVRDENNDKNAMEAFSAEQEVVNLIHKLPPEIQRLYVAMSEAAPEGFKFGIDIKGNDDGGHTMSPIFIPTKEN